ncbi:hypothetical protein LWI28_000605 [Acer negundo]|uniref:ENT domain-containing protein n=1 Tax=Acer negundo TaxID=4023 RepID=A0AAD5NYU3_ACENE|nr:hypothetical protein LWI28_000605 [Acer negundo]
MRLFLLRFSLFSTHNIVKEDMIQLKIHYMDKLLYTEIKIKHRFFLQPNFTRSSEKILLAIMRFKKGSKVEVFCRNEVPSGAWRCAEIISGNGHNYTVRYAQYLGKTNNVYMDKVSRKAIRPCPPAADCAESWMAGDVVEVFDDFSWKIATILKVLSGDSSLVRLLGSSREFQAHKMNIRVRKSWQDDEWVLIGKGSGSSEVAKYKGGSTFNSHKKMSFRLAQADADLEVQEGNNCFGIKSATDLQESHVVSRMLKRASPYGPFAEACTGNIQKMIAVEKDGEHQRVISRNTSSLLKKVDAVAYPRKNLGETYMHASSNNLTNGYYGMVRGKPKCVEYSHGRSLEANDSDIDVCSVGSCSISSDSTSMLSSRILAGDCEEADNISSDAESFSGRGDEEEKSPLPVGEDVAARIHRLELHAYRSTLEALYASGPLSWEQEALLTNLRITLHISNDEHLMELRNLISAGTSPYIDQ